MSPGADVQKKNNCG